MEEQPEPKRIIVHKLCRICLKEKHLRDVRLLKLETPKIISDIHRYYNVKISLTDRKSKKICKRCLRKLEAWGQDLDVAKKSQLVVDFLDEWITKHQLREESDAQSDTQNEVPDLKQI